MNLTAMLADERERRDALRREAFRLIMDPTPFAGRDMAVLRAEIAEADRSVRALTLVIAAQVTDANEAP